MTVVVCVSDTNLSLCNVVLQRLFYWSFNAIKMFQTEYFFTCPYCWQQISFIIDLSIDSQTYIEDCDVCCNPIEVSYTVFDQNIESFKAEKIGQ